MIIRIIVNKDLTMVLHEKPVLTFELLLLLLLDPGQSWEHVEDGVVDGQLEIGWTETFGVQDSET